MLRLIHLFFILAPFFVVSLFVATSQAVETFTQYDNTDVVYHYSLNVNSYYGSPHTGIDKDTENIESYLRLFAPFWQQGVRLSYLTLGYGYNIDNTNAAEVGLGYREYFNTTDIITGVYGYYVGREVMLLGQKEAVNGSIGQGKIGLEFWFKNLFLGGHYDFPVYEAYARSYIPKDFTHASLQDVKNQDYKTLFIQKVHEEQYDIDRSLNGFTASIGYDIPFGFRMYGNIYENRSYDIYGLPTSYLGAGVELVLEIRQLLAIETPIFGNIRAEYQYDKLRGHSVTVGLDLGVDLNGNNIYQQYYYTHMAELPYIKNAINITGNSGVYDDILQSDPYQIDGHDAIVGIANSESDFYNSKIDIFQVESENINLKNSLHLRDYQIICGAACNITYNDEAYKIPLIKEIKYYPTLNFDGDGIQLGKNNAIYSINVHVNRDKKSVFYDDTSGDMGNTTLDTIETNGRMWFQLQKGFLIINKITFKTGTETSLTMDQASGHTLQDFGGYMVGDLSIVSTAGNSGDVSVTIKNVTINPDNDRHDYSGLILWGNMQSYGLDLSSVNVKNENGDDVCGLCSSMITGKHKDSVYIKQISVTGQATLYGIWNTGNFDEASIGKIIIDDNDTQIYAAFYNSGNITKLVIQDVNQDGGTIFKNAATGTVTNTTIAKVTGKPKYIVDNAGTISSTNEYSGLTITGNIDYTTIGIRNTGTLNSSGDHKAIVVTKPIHGPQDIEDHGNTTSPNIEIK